MARIGRLLKAEWRTLLLVSLGAGVQLFLVTRSLDFLVTYLVPDDAFYYFQIARHIAAGSGPTFDGINPTNGFHPLWLLILIPIFSYFSTGGGSDVAPIYAALLFTVIINAGTALVVARILSRFSENANIRALGLFIWIFNPFLLYETVNGLETSLSLFFFALFFLLALRFGEGKLSTFGVLASVLPRSTLSRSLIVIGVVGALMTLARLDLAIYGVFFALWLLVREGMKDNLRCAIIFGITATVVALPWFLWSLSNFQTFLTSSSEASTIVNHALIVQDHGDSWFQTWKAVIYTSHYELDKLFERTGMYALACALLGAALALVALGSFRIPRRIALLTVAQALAIGFLGLFFVNAGIRWTARSWYFVSANLYLAILAVAVVDVLTSRIVWKKTAWTTLLFVLAFSFTVNWSKTLRHGMPHQLEMYRAALWMNDNLPEGSVIGVFNAGIQGYFSRHTVINLDGLVNNAALGALKRRELLAYIEVNQIRYIADFDVYLTYRYKSFFGGDPFQRLTLVHRAGVSEDAPVGGIAIYSFK